jgi:RNA polymerase sigma-70 factor (ECF subfamily)
LLQDLSFGLLLLLERLSPLERAAFLLHDVFDMDFDTVAEVLESSPAACRQLAVRGRQHLQQDRQTPRYRPSAEEGRSLTNAFLRAAYTGDATTLASMLAEDARLISDGGGRRPAALNPLIGADRIVRFFVGLVAKARAAGVDLGLTARPATLNGLPGALVFESPGPGARRRAGVRRQPPGPVGLHGAEPPTSCGRCLAPTDFTMAPSGATDVSRWSSEVRGGPV